MADFIVRECIILHHMRYVFGFDLAQVSESA